MDQLLRSTTLIMRWPEVVRWLRRGGGSELQPSLADQAQGGMLPTLTTRILLHFFRKEYIQEPEDQRLLDGVSIELW